MSDGTFYVEAERPGEAEFDAAVLPAEGSPQYQAISWVPASVWTTQEGMSGFAHFGVLEIEGISLPDGAPLFWRIDAASNADPTRDVNEAEFAFRGTVKWDGCVNFGQPDNGSDLHACTKEQMAALGAALIAGYDLALARVGGGL